MRAHAAALAAAVLAVAASSSPNLLDCTASTKALDGDTIRTWTCEGVARTRQIDSSRYLDEAARRGSRRLRRQATGSGNSDGAGSSPTEATPASPSDSAAAPTTTSATTVEVEQPTTTTTTTTQPPAQTTTTPAQTSSPAASQTTTSPPAQQRTSAQPTTTTSQPGQQQTTSTAPAPSTTTAARGRSDTVPTALDPQAWLTCLIPRGTCLHRYLIDDKSGSSYDVDVGSGVRKRCEQCSCGRKQPVVGFVRECRLLLHRLWQ